MIKSNVILLHRAMYTGGRHESQSPSSFLTMDEATLGWKS